MELHSHFRRIALRIVRLLPASPATPEHGPIKTHSDDGPAKGYLGFTDHRQRIPSQGGWRCFSCRVGEYAARAGRARIFHQDRMQASGFEVGRQIIELPALFARQGPSIEN